MGSSLRLCVLVLLALVFVQPAAGQELKAETFSFPQTHDTAFGTNLFLGNFFWYAHGDGAKGRRTSNEGIVSVRAFGFNLALGPSCVFNVTPVFIDAYLNDRLVASAPMPGNVVCNSVPDPPVVQMQVEFDPPIAGLGAGNDYEVRLQLRGSMSPIEDLLVFYAIDTSVSTVGIAGFTAAPPPPPPPPPPPDLSHTDITGQIQQSESNIIQNQGSALAAVRDALGVVEGNVQASIAGAVLNVNSATALGFANLSNQLGVQTGDLLDAIKGNGTAIQNVQQAIANQVLPQLQANGNAIEQVRDNFLNTTLGQALATGGRILGFMTGGGILQVADFVRHSIDQVINGNLRPDRIIRRATAEFNRGLRRLRRIFSLTEAGPDAERLAAALADLPGGDEAAAGPDNESEDIFGAYVWFERAYQTLVKGQANNAPAK